MLSTKEFGRNKFVKWVSYIIVGGFSLMMFLPSLNLAEIFTGASPNIVDVNGVDIYTKDVAGHDYHMYYSEYSKSGFSILRLFDGELKEAQSDPTVGNRLAWMLNNWQEVNQDPQMERLRQMLIERIMWQMNLDLAKDLGYDLSNDKLAEHIEASYQKFLGDMFKAYNEKVNKPGVKPDSILNKKEYIAQHYDDYWKNYSEWGKAYLRERYLNGLITNTLQGGAVGVLPDIEQEYFLAEYKVKVDYAIYSYDDYIHSPEVLNVVDLKELKEYYTKEEERVLVEKATFDSEEKLKEAKKDPELFEVPERAQGDEATKPPIKKYPTEIETIETKHKWYSWFSKHKKDEIIERQDDEDVKKFYAFKIISKSESFDVVKKDKGKLLEIATKFAQGKYDKLKKGYEKKAQEVLKAFHEKAMEAKEFAKVKGIEFAGVRIGRTEFFDQNARTVNEEKKPAKEGSDKKTPGDSIIEFVTYGRGGVKQQNETFFKSAFSLKKEDVSQVLSEDMIGIEKPRKVFFMIKKVDEKLPDFKNFTADKQKELVNRIKFSDLQIFRRNWVKYLMEKNNYQVKINIEYFVRSLGLPIQRVKEKSSDSN